MDLPPFIAPRLKLQRARDHISELDRAITSFLARKPFSLVIEQKEEWHAWTARLRDNVPLEFSAIIGDAVHNLRTALDVLACDLVSINGQSTRSVYFPFAADPADLKHQIRKKNLHRAGPDIVDLVLSLRPYRGGNLALRAIHDLDIRDKHQALIPVANVVDAPGGTLMLGGHPNKIPNWQSRVTYDGQIIVMMPAVANLSVGDEIAASFTLAFADTDPMAGREVVKALHDLAELTASILETFKAHCEGSDDKIAQFAGIQSGAAEGGRALLVGSTGPRS